MPGCTSTIPSMIASAGRSPSRGADIVQDISRVEDDAAHSLRRKQAQHQGNQVGQWLATMIPWEVGIEVCTDHLSLGCRNWPMTMAFVIEFSHVLDVVWLSNGLKRNSVA